jgi:hypothetical protein
MGAAGIILCSTYCDNCFRGYNPTKPCLSRQVLCLSAQRAMQQTNIVFKAPVVTSFYWSFRAGMMLDREFQAKPGVTSSW